ncbi:MAG: hypothetical protein IPK80_27740 [Nannocystis sp.]|nr:hypothetical protein [Nannocystis sp.]
MPTSTAFAATWVSADAGSGLGPKAAARPLPPPPTGTPSPPRLRRDRAIRSQLTEHGFRIITLTASDLRRGTALAQDLLAAG